MKCWPKPFVLPSLPPLHSDSLLRPQIKGIRPDLDDHFDAKVRPPLTSSRREVMLRFGLVQLTGAKKKGKKVVASEDEEEELFSDESMASARPVKKKVVAKKGKAKPVEVRSTCLLPYYC